ncbi:MAG: T9SS type A sorting domain-containing protein [Bacteroidetes bacterium]|nr:T9SS type A sorting domain-containing protein [Bacteroidota bacterium]
MKTRKLLFLKGLIPFLLFTGISLFSTAQSYKWAHQGSSEGFDYGNAITIDDSANVYLTGQIEFSAQFDNGIHLNSNGKHDILYAKYNSAGQLIWAKHAGGTSGDVGWGIGLDASQNIYTVGEFEYTAGFGPGDSISVYGSNDIFLTKHTSDGTFQWAKNFGGSSDDKAKAIAVDDAGNCYITGYFSSNGSFGSVNLTSSSSSNDVVLFKTNSTGTVLWAKKGGGTKEDRGRGVVLDGQGNVYITGTFTTSATFNGNNISSTGTNSTFVAKYDINGNFQWVRSSGACCDTTRGNAISVDASGNVYIAGYFKSQTTIGSNSFTSFGSSDVIVMKYDPNGNVLWAKQAGGPYEDMAYACTYDQRNDLLYVTGQIDDHGYFGTIYVGAAGNRDAFTVAYDPNGNEVWARPGGGNQRDAGQAITCDTLGNIYTSGFFNDTASFGTSTLQGYPLADFFVAKMAPPLATQPTTNATSVSSAIVNCNNLQLSFTQGDGNRRVIVASAGSPVSLMPTDGNYYTASSVFGSGTDLGLGNFIVYDGTGNSATLSGLSPGITYYFRIVEYNGVGYASNYLTGGATSYQTVVNSFTISATSDQAAICNGGSTNLHAGQAASYLWSPSTGLSSTTDSVVNASPISATTYTVTATDNSGCTSTATVSIGVGTSPTVSFANLNVICENANPVTLTGGSPAGGVYTGTGVTSGNFNPITSGAGQFIITYTYTNSSGCSASDTSLIVVRAKPTVSLSNFSAVCVNGSPVTRSGGSPAGGSYSGTGVASNIFTPSTAGTGSQTITYSYTDANGCSNSTTATILVNGLPIVNFATPSDVCVNSPAVTLTGGTPAGGTYSGTNVSAGQFTPSSSGQFTLNYSYTDIKNCSATATTTITVRALPTVAAGNYSALCSNAAAITLANGSPSGGTYSGDGVSGNQFNPAAVVGNTAAITYTYTDGFGCTAGANTSITVNSLPTVTFANIPSLCANGTPVTLTQGSPAGGSYSGTGVSGTSFSPATAGPGTFTLTYNFTNASGCSSSAQSSVTVNSNPTVTQSSFTALCANANPVTLSGGSPTGGTYSGQGVSSGAFNPSVGQGFYTITYSFTNSNGCPGTASAIMTVNPVPSVSAGSYAGVCSNGSSIVLNAGTPVGGTYSGTGVTNNNFNPALVNGSSSTVTYSYANGYGCSSTATTTIAVNPAPVVSLGSDTTVCADSHVTLNVGSGFSTVNWSNGATTSSIMVDSAGIGYGVKTIIVTVSNAAACSASDTLNITFDACQSVKQITDDNFGVYIYPNPFTNTFTILSEQRMDCKIFDVSGRLVSSHENITGSFSSGEQLAPGSYFFEFTCKEFRKVMVVVKAN